MLMKPRVFFIGLPVLSEVSGLPPGYTLSWIGHKLQKSGQAHTFSEATDPVFSQLLQSADFVCTNALTRPLHPTPHLQHSLS